MSQCRFSSDNALPDCANTGIKVSTVHCLSDSTQTYVVARPETFNKDRFYPVVFVFDPHGDGNLAVSTFRAGASELGYIIAGSHVIRNGYDSIE
ncbi:MAG: hypothetical protein JXR41_13335 [Bacteroidales bacterium]|nr:hypothetical protein [Bacteroidales bacterium]MBN2764070.1 hypothetical protein [Bacteroidales bacterium]